MSGTLPHYLVNHLQKNYGKIRNSLCSWGNGSIENFLKLGDVSENGGLRTSKDSLLHKSNVNPGKNGQNFSKTLEIEQRLTAVWVAFT